MNKINPTYHVRDVVPPGAPHLYGVSLKTDDATAPRLYLHALRCQYRAVQRAWGHVHRVATALVCVGRLGLAEAYLERLQALTREITAWRVNVTGAYTPAEANFILGS